MATVTLGTLSEGYAERDGRATLSGLRALAAKYLQKRTISILDAAAIGLAFDVVFSADKVDLSQITPDMTEAWSLAYPHVPIESLADRSPQELAGIISGWKGKLFEVDVEQRLNAGEWVGDLHLEPGQVAVLADSPVQAGWDLQIMTPDGGVGDTIQLKATESVSYIHEALSRYPVTPIVATHEVAARMPDSGIIDSGVLNEQLTDSVTDHISGATTDAVGDGIIGAMPISVILATEAYQVLSGKKSVDDAVTSGGDRLVKGAVAGGVAAVVSVIATPLVGAIAGFITRLALGSQGDMPQKSSPIFVPPSLPRMYSKVKLLCDEARTIRKHYLCDCSNATEPKSPDFSDSTEILRLVDDDTRLQIEQGEMPLASWVRMMTQKDMESMSESDFKRHLSDLRKIRKEEWIKRAIPASGFFDNFARQYNDQRLRRDLDDALGIGGFLEKRLSGKLTDAEDEELKLAKMTPAERNAYKREQDRESREKLEWLREQLRRKRAEKT